jgi:hypothetical protein
VNQKLSEERAQAVMNHLIGRGVPFTRLRFEGKGASLPAADNRTEEGRAKNRRVEVFIRRKSASRFDSLISSCGTSRYFQGLVPTFRRVI